MMLAGVSGECEPLTDAVGPLDCFALPVRGSNNGQVNSPGAGEIFATGPPPAVTTQPR